ncbi:7166_t:CDS:2, partial [Dentiscutata heterogama]
NEGSYLYSSILCYTLPPKNYPIPDNYSVKTTWGREKSQQTIQFEEFRDKHTVPVKPAKQYSQQDSVKLKSFEYSVNNQNYFFNFKDDSEQKRAEILNM